MTKKEQKKLTAKLEKAYHFRDFEINMYWKRAQYFWGFLAVIYAGYFLLVTYQGACNLPKQYKLFTCSIGVLMSFAWYLVNRGSKRWQEHWEKMIIKYEQLTDFIVYGEATTVEEGFLHAGKFSVSRINIVISFYVFISWILLYLFSIEDILKINNYELTIGFSTIIGLLFTYFLSKSKH